jgi:hypothetical protein
MEAEGRVQAIGGLNCAPGPGMPGSDRQELRIGILVRP